MVKILCIGDPHYTDKNIEYIKKLEEKVIEIVKNQDIFATIFMGDILDGHRKVYSDLQNRAIKFIRKTNQYCNVFVIIGNHDYIDNKQFLSDNHCLFSLKKEEELIKELNSLNGKKYNNLFIIDKVRIVDLKPENEKYTLCFTPYVPPGKLKDALKTKKSYNSDDIDIIFAHQEIKGCDMGIIESLIGDEWNENDPLIISGHIHKHQIKNNILYVGTPYQTNISENEDKGLLLLGINEKLDNYINFIDKKIKIYYDIIKLDIKKKKTIYIDLKDIDTFNLPNDNNLYRLIITHNNPEELKITKTKIINQLQNQNIIKIEFKLIENNLIQTDNIISNLKYNFFDIIKQKLKNEHIQTYTKLLNY
jgi:DNA repair exonuclease SbcCD nuclease subunit